MEYSQISLIPKPFDALGNEETLYRIYKTRKPHQLTAHEIIDMHDYYIIGLIASTRLRRNEMLTAVLDIRADQLLDAVGHKDAMFIDFTDDIYNLYSGGQDENGRELNLLNLKYRLSPYTNPYLPSHKIEFDPLDLCRPTELEYHESLSFVEWRITGWRTAFFISETAMLGVYGFMINTIRGYGL